MKEKKKNVVVTYQKDKFLDELWIDWQMLIPAKIGATSSKALGRLRWKLFLHMF